MKSGIHLRRQVSRIFFALFPRCFLPKQSRISPDEQPVCKDAHCGCADAQAVCKVQQAERRTPARQQASSCHKDRKQKSRAAGCSPQHGNGIIQTLENPYFNSDTILLNMLVFSSNPANSCAPGPYA